MIDYDYFSKIELKVAEIVEAQRVEKSDKLLQLQISLGANEKRQIIAGVGKTYEPEKLIGKQIVIVANLEPRSLMGLESQGMLLAAHNEDGDPVLLSVDDGAPSGSEIG